MTHKNLNNERKYLEKDAYRVSEFCERYSISRTALYREIWANRLQIIKCGRRTLIARVDAERWLDVLRQVNGPVSTTTE